MMTPFSNDNSYGLVIGVGQRPDSGDSNVMEISLSDAKEVGTALTSFCKVPDIRELLGENATRPRIEKEFEILSELTQQKKANLVVVYFSGHGCMYGGEYYLIGRDTKNNNISGTAIAGKVFVTMLQSIQADKMLVLLDCCHAGGVAEPAEIPFERPALLNHPNRVAITAGHKSQVSYLSKPVSIFTYALIEGLGGIHFLEGDKAVTVFDLAMYIRERVVTLSQQVLQLEDPQKPQLHALENQQTSNFILARYANGQARKMFFEEDFSACKANGKEINADVANTEDLNYRNNFYWLNVTVVGDGNYIINNPQNSPITINNGLSVDQLKEILKGYLPAAEKLMTILKNKPDEASKKLHEKMDISDIELLVEKGTPDNIQVAIDRLLNKVKEMEPRPKTYSFMVNLNGAFATYKEEELLGMNIAGQLAGIRTRFIKIIEDYKRWVL